MFTAKKCSTRKSQNVGSSFLTFPPCLPPPPTHTYAHYKHKHQRMSFKILVVKSLKTNLWCKKSNYVFSLHCFQHYRFFTWLPTYFEIKQKCPKSWRGYDSSKKHTNFEGECMTFFAIFFDSLHTFHFMEQKPRASLTCPRRNLLMKRKRIVCFREIFNPLRKHIFILVFSLVKRREQ